MARGRWVVAMTVAAGLTALPTLAAAGEPSALDAFAVNPSALESHSAFAFGDDALATTGGVSLGRMQVDGLGIGLGIAGESPARGPSGEGWALLGPENEGGAALFGSVDLDSAWALTGGVDGGGDIGIGLRFTTRAGEEVLLAIEPQLSFQSGDASGRVPGSIALGAGATLAAGDRWYLTGVARLERPTDRTQTTGETSYIGGFVTGLRF